MPSGDANVQGGAASGWLTAGRPKQVQLRHLVNPAVLRVLPLVRRRHQALLRCTLVACHARRWLVSIEG